MTEQRTPHWTDGMTLEEVVASLEADLENQKKEWQEFQKNGWKFTTKPLDEVDHDVLTDLVFFWQRDLLAVVPVREIPYLLPEQYVLYRGWIKDIRMKYGMCEFRLDTELDVRVSIQIKDIVGKIRNPEELEWRTADEILAWEARSREHMKRYFGGSGE